MNLKMKEVEYLVLKNYFNQKIFIIQIKLICAKIYLLKIGKI